MPNAPLELNLELVLHQIPEYVVLLNTQGEVIFFNKEAERLQQDAKRPLELGASFINIVDPERKTFFLETIEHLNERRLAVTTDAAFKDENDSVFYFEINYIPILDAADALIQICILAREITPQKIYEKKTNQLVHELSLLIEDANAIVFGVDSLGYITDWNKESVRITQLDKSDVFTKKMSSLIDEDSQKDFDELLEGSLKGELMSNRELLIKAKGATFTALMNSTPKRNSLGHVIGVLFVGQDISELVNYRKSLEEKVVERTESLKKALQKEQELVDLKNKFVSIASHEFKMPLAAIGNSTNLMKSTPRQAKTNREQLAIIEKQISIMRALLDDVLTLEKSDSNKLKAKLQSLDIVAFLNRLSEEIILATGQTHRIRTNFSHREVYIESDEKLLRNIFSNILSNAIKFSPLSKEVYLELKSSSSGLQIAIRDEGIGIPPEDLKRVFEPFNRGLNASEIKGTGLGLSIVKKATETLGGTLDIISEIGKGTTITIKFPSPKTHSQNG